jgi:gliding motility-associated-like protein
MFKSAKIVLVVLQALFLFYTETVLAQIELVPDTGFNYFEMPTQYLNPQEMTGQLKYWYNPTKGTPDYYCSCDVAGQSIQYTPLQENKTSLGLFFYQPPYTNVREYISTRLKNNLNVKYNYFISINMALLCSAKIGTNKFGILFSSDSIANFDSIIVINRKPQVEIDTTLFLNQRSTILDANYWYELNFTYKPDSSTYRYLTIGNFYPDNKTDTVSAVGIGCCDLGCQMSVNYRVSYYLFDYVSIKEFTDNKNLVINDTSICSSTGITLSNNESAAGHTYSWYTKDGFVSNELNASVSPNVNTTYYLYTTDAFDNECNCNPPILDSVRVTVINTGTKINNQTDGELCAGDTIQIGFEPINNYKYSWSPATYLNQTYISNPYLQIPWYLENEKLEYNLIITDTSGRTCTLKNNWAYIFNISFCPDSLEPQIYIPNIFTVNGDNENDVFKLSTQNIKNLNAEIYNRWGIRINSFSGTNGVWQGNTIAGDSAPNGIYYVIITAEGMDKNTYHYSGYVQLMK